jgi:hypothetical protein
LLPQGPGGGKGEDLQAHLIQLDQRLLVEREQRNLRVLLPQVGGQTRGWPTQAGHGLDRHQAMGHVGQDVSGSKALEVLIF